MKHTFFLPLLIVLSSLLHAGEATVTITSPINGSTITAKQPTITGSVFSSGSPVPGTEVDIILNGSALASVLTDANGIFTVTAADYGSRELQSGTNTIKAELTSFFTGSATIQVTLKTASPVSISKVIKTGDISTTIQGIAAAGATVILSINPALRAVTSNCSGIIGTTTADASGNWSLDVIFNCAPGTYTLTATSDGATTSVTVIITDKSDAGSVEIANAISNKYCSDIFFI